MSFCGAGAGATAFTMTSTNLYYDIAGSLSYEEAGERQDFLKHKVQSGALEAALLFFEPSQPVYTLGRRSSAEDFRLPLEEIRAQGILLHPTDRGGRVTYHGPGQLVTYVIFDLNRLRLKIPELVTLIEDCLCEFLKGQACKAHTDKAYPGVWVGRSKIASVGLHVDRAVTSHGFCLNLNPNLEHYRSIYPCGIRDRGVTSLAKEGKEVLEFGVAASSLVKIFTSRLSLRPNPLRDLLQRPEYSRHSLLSPGEI